MSIDVELTDLAYGGDAVGRYEGRVLFVPGAGERVRVEIVEERRGHARADLLEILRPAPERVESSYPLLTECGCQWQHIAYPAQLTWKAHIVRPLLVRIGKQPDAVVHPALGMPNGISPWHYRNIALFSIGPAGEVGFKLTDSHDVQDLEDCPLLHPALDMVYQCVREKLINYFGETLSEKIQGFTIRGAIGAVNSNLAAANDSVKPVPALWFAHRRPPAVGKRAHHHRPWHRRRHRRTRRWALWTRSLGTGILDRHDPRLPLPRLLRLLLPGQPAPDRRSY